MCYVCVCACVMCVCACVMCVCRRLADLDGDNALSQSEFLAAMKLVMMRRKGHDIPVSVPDSLLADLRPRE